MKKFYLLTMVLGVLVTITSCKKDYSCHCSGVGVSFSYDTVFTDLKKKDAEVQCNSLDFTFFGYGQDCELK